MTRRWPGFVYDDGDEPDPRFSFANERTFLAWVRTALALLAAGVALYALPLSLSNEARDATATALMLLAVASSASGWVRWARSERAMRRSAPLPGLGIGIVLAGGTVVVALVLLVALVL